MKKLKSLALTTTLAIALVFPMNAFSMPTGGLVIKPTGFADQSNGQAANCSRASFAPGISSGRAAVIPPTALGATWSAAIGIIVSMLGQLNANALAGTKCENIKN